MGEGRSSDGKENCMVVGGGGGRGAGRPLGERRLFAPGDFSFSILHLVFAQLHADKNSVSGNSSYL